jgi:hypothetical protein
MPALVIHKVEDYITNIDPVDLGAQYLSDVRGFRFDRPGVIGYRDWGTIKRYPSTPSGVTLVGGYSLYIPTENVEYDVVIGYDAYNSLRIFVYNSGNLVWDELTKLYKANLNASPAATDTTAGILNVRDILDASATLGNGDLRQYIAVNVSQAGEALIVVDSTPLTFSTLVYMGSSGVTWLDGDEIWFYRMTGILPDTVLGTDRGYRFTNGSSPHLRWLPQEAQNKVTLFYGDSNEPISGKHPLQIRKSNFTSDASTTYANVYYYFDDLDAQRSIHLLNPDQFIGNDATIEPTVPHLFGQIAFLAIGTTTGWYIDKAQLLPDYQSTGSASVPKDIADGDVTLTLNEGIAFTIDFSAGASTAKYHTRFYITALYRGTDAATFYQESDPIAQVFLSTSAGTGFPQITPTIKIDLAKLNKSLAGFRIYEAIKNDTDIASIIGNWFDSAEEYIQVKQILLTDSGWTTVATTVYHYQFVVPAISSTVYYEALASAASTLDANLGHTVDKNRSYMSPLFGIRAGRGQESVIVVVQDDRTLRLSSYDGAGVHEDDNFPDLSIDNATRSLKVPLNGKGSVKGLALLGGKILVFRNSELESFFFDNSGSLVAEGIYPIDFWAKDSLTGIGLSDNPLGVAWAGNYALYYLPALGGGRQIINERQLNFYNGDLLTSDKVTPFVTSTFRQGVITAFCPATNEIIFQVETYVDDGYGATPTTTEYLGLCYNVETRKCRVRKLSRRIRFYNNRKDNTLTLGGHTALLQYPNKTTYSGGHAWEDELTSAGVSASLGIDSRLKINARYSLDPKEVYNVIDLDFVGRATNNNLFDVNLYLDGAVAPYDTISYRANDIPTRRKIKPIGQAKRLEIEVKIPSTYLYQFKQLEIRTISLLHETQTKVGEN